MSSGCTECDEGPVCSTHGSNDGIDASTVSDVNEAQEAMELIDEVSGFDLIKSLPEADSYDFDSLVTTVDVYRVAHVHINLSLFKNGCGIRQRLNCVFLNKDGDTLFEAKAWAPTDSKVDFLVTGDTKDYDEE